MNDHNGQLASYIDRVQALEVEKRERAEDIREVLKEAKDAGLNPSAIKALVKDRLKTEEQREKQKVLESAINEYRAAIGAFILTPLGRAGAERLSA